MFVRWDRSIQRLLRNGTSKSSITLSYSFSSVKSVDTFAALHPWSFQSLVAQGISYSYSHCSRRSFLPSLRQIYDALKASEVLGSSQASAQCEPHMSTDAKLPPASSLFCRLPNTPPHRRVPQLFSARIALCSLSPLLMLVPNCFAALPTQNIAQQQEVYVLAVTAPPALSGCHPSCCSNIAHRIATWSLRCGLVRVRHLQSKWEELYSMCNSG
jgi:hypothetical protein